MTDDRYERGMGVRREVLGDAHVDAALADGSALTGDFQELITRYAWGEIWARPGLDRRTRSCITLTALVAGGHDARARACTCAQPGATASPGTRSRRCSCTTAIYCGVPAANSAFAVAQRVQEEEGGE